MAGNLSFLSTLQMSKYKRVTAWWYSGGTQDKSTSTALALLIRGLIEIPNIPTGVSTVLKIWQAAAARALRLGAWAALSAATFITPRRSSPRFFRSRSRHMQSGKKSPSWTSESNQAAQFRAGFEERNFLIRERKWSISQQEEFNWNWF